MTLTSRSPYLTHSRLKCSEQKWKGFHFAPMARMTSLDNLVRFFIDPQGSMHGGHHIYAFISWTTCSLELHHNTGARVKPVRIMLLWSAHKHNLLSLLSFVTEVNSVENLTSFCFQLWLTVCFLNVVKSLAIEPKHCVLNVATRRKQPVSSLTTEQEKGNYGSEYWVGNADF